MTRLRSILMLSLVAAIACAGAACTTMPAGNVIPGGNDNGGNGGQNNNNGGGGGETVLLDQTTTCTPFRDNFGNLVTCFIDLTFNPTAAGREIKVEVEATLTTSRPTLFVFDANNNVVANENNPLSNKVSATFESQNTTAHQILIEEIVNLNSNYTVTVTQSGS